MEVIIRPKEKWWRLDVKELWAFRDLFYFFTWRDVKVKYKQTVVGAVWAVFQPVITMIIFTIFFGKFVKVPSDGIPYPVFFYVGSVFWTLFSSGLSQASNSFVMNERIVTKIYFPRFILPFSSIITNVTDFVIALGLLFVLMVVYKVPITLVGVLAIPVLTIGTVLAALGIGLFFASLNVKYRDVRFILPFFIQLLIFITPVIYPISIVSQRYRWILGLNPMSGVIDTARTLILGSGSVDWLIIGISCASTVFYCFLGYLYFKKVERYFADVI